MYEIVRKTLIIVLCLMVSKMLHLKVGVFIIVFGIVFANRLYSKHILVLLNRMKSSLFAALVALFVNQLFTLAPFLCLRVFLLCFSV